jgi:NADP-dependent 3-hydroxy acid dehydrogenase YdfG
VSDHLKSYLSDRVVVVTGAASGFGRLICQLTAARGAAVVAADVTEDGLKTLVAEIEEAGGRAAYRRTDVTDRADTNELGAFAVETFGAIDVLVNSAGTMPLAFCADHAAAAEAWDRCIDVNFKGVLHGITAVHDQMISQGRGHIVNISSIYGNAPVAGAGVYGATKAAVNVLSESLRVESQGRIKVTVVRPTGVPGTGLGGSIINGEAIIGLLGHNMDLFRERATAAFGGGTAEEQAALTNPENIEYWAISPEELAAQIVYVIDQPWGISISDITVRASGEQYLF